MLLLADQASLRARGLGSYEAAYCYREATLLLAELVFTPRSSTLRKVGIENFGFSEQNEWVWG